MLAFLVLFLDFCSKFPILFQFLVIQFLNYINSFLSSSICTLWRNYRGKFKKVKIKWKIRCLGVRLLNINFHYPTTGLACLIKQYLTPFPRFTFYFRFLRRALADIAVNALRRGTLRM